MLTNVSPTAETRPMAAMVIKIGMFRQMNLEMLLSCANLFVELDEIGSAKALLSFLHDNKAVSRTVREQASDIIAAGLFAQAASRYQTLEEALIAARQNLCDS